MEGDDFKKLQRKTKKFGAKYLDYSKRKNIKYVVEYKGKKIHFGSTKYEDYVIHNTLIRKFNKGFIEISGRVSNNIIRINLNDNLTMFYIFDNGINHFHFYNTGDRQFNADIVISYM